jgi:hypothetical protein
MNLLAAAVDGNDNVWISNFAMPSSPIVQLCGVRIENCPPGMKYSLGHTY